MCRGSSIRSSNDKDLPLVLALEYINAATNKAAPKQRTAAVIIIAITTVPADLFSAISLSPLTTIVPNYLKSNNLIITKREILNFFLFYYFYVLIY